MTHGREAIRWHPRVLRDKIRRLYLSEARGLLDEELLDEVGITLYLRCISILQVEDARQGRVHCPLCYRDGRETLIVRESGEQSEMLRCPVCGWMLTFGEYASAYKRKQLNLGGAGDAFRSYVAAYPDARTPRAKMLLVDGLIHAFHYSLRAQPDLPTRAACVNLIKGRLRDVERLLDDLAYGEGTRPEIVATRQRWYDERERIPWRTRLPSEQEGSSRVQT